MHQRIGGPAKSNSFEEINPVLWRLSLRPNIQALKTLNFVEVCCAKLQWNCYHGHRAKEETKLGVKTIPRQGLDYK